MVQLHSITMVRAVHATAVLFLKTYEENGTTVEYLLPVCSKHNAIFFAHNPFKDGAYIEVPSSKNAKLQIQ